MDPKPVVGVSDYATFANNPILFKDPNGLSAVAEKNDEEHTITITSNWISYGPGSNPLIARFEADRIQGMLNSANATTTINGIEYKLQFIIHGDYLGKDYTYNGLKGEDAIEERIKSNTDFKDNFVRYDRVNASSGMDGNFEQPDPVPDIGGWGGNTGLLRSDQVLSTTGTHEYLHGIGLRHLASTGYNYILGKPELDLSGEKHLDIMFTLDDMYTQIVTLPAGTTLSNGKPDISKRQVTEKTLNNILWNKLKFDANGITNIGFLSNKYHKPEPLPMQGPKKPRSHK